MHQSILVYRGYRYLKWAAALILAAVVLYAGHQPPIAPNGGTWLGYTLGTVGAAMVLWLMWFGVRKRSYAEGATRLQDWLSAHVYLGLALVVVATLHTGFDFGWNVHTLAYVLMLVIVASGIFGVYAYIRYPSLMTANRKGQTLRELMATIAEIDSECREVALRLDDRLNAAVEAAVTGTRVGGSVREQLRGDDPACPTTAALALVRGAAGSGEGEAARDQSRLAVLLARKVELLKRARRDVQLKALMEIWLFLHVPLSFGLLAALLAHVLSIFFYW